MSRASKRKKTPAWEKARELRAARRAQDPRVQSRADRHRAEAAERKRQKAAESAALLAQYEASKAAKKSA